MKYFGLEGLGLGRIIYLGSIRIVLKGLVKYMGWDWEGNFEFGRLGEQKDYLGITKVEQGCGEDVILYVVIITLKSRLCSSTGRVTEHEGVNASDCAAWKAGRWLRVNVEIT